MQLLAVVLSAAVLLQFSVQGQPRQPVGLPTRQCSLSQSERDIVWGREGAHTREEIVNIVKTQGDNGVKAGETLPTDRQDAAANTETSRKKRQVLNGRLCRLWHVPIFDRFWNLVPCESDQWQPSLCYGSCPNPSPWTYHNGLAEFKQCVGCRPKYPYCGWVRFTCTLGPLTWSYYKFKTLYRGCECKYC